MAARRPSPEPLALSRLSATTLPNAAAFSSKSAFDVQIFGAARVFWPLFELSGNSDGSFCAVSVHCAKAASTLAASNGAWPRIIRTTISALSWFSFISPLRVAIGSDCAITAPAPSTRNAAAIAAPAGRPIGKSLSCGLLAGPIPSDKHLSHKGYSSSLQRTVIRNNDHEIVNGLGWQFRRAPRGSPARSAAALPAYQRDGCGERATARRRSHS